MDPTEAASEDYRAFWKQLGAGHFAARKFRRFAKGGREVRLQATYNPVLDAAGKPFKVIKLAVDITEAEQDAARRETDRQQAEQAQGELVQTLARTLSQLSKGDLTVRIEGERAGSHKTVQDDFNAAVESLRLTLDEVLQSVGTIRNGSEEIAGASDDLSRRTEQQAASLDLSTTGRRQLRGLGLGAPCPCGP